MPAVNALRIQPTATGFSGTLIPRPVTSGDDQLARGRGDHEANRRLRRTVSPEVIALRVGLAQETLDEAETVDLASASNADLVGLIDDLRASLSSMIRLHGQRDALVR